ncbi:hypothetical protein T05_4157 [Trichinella murrelli]|uniref:Uncharacterized protein n=1 Tax=Trichinella murrelli TaxID=144512 RepID=A0A0V0T4R4_9BILA|nr:hypothetical protein T05_4157 [Trichinella murrelli]
MRNVVVNVTVNGPGRDGLIKSILDLEKSLQQSLMLIIQVLEFEGDHSGELEAECKSAVFVTTTTKLHLRITFTFL